ncbi:MAG: AAA family ATPase [Methanothrix sp.]
MHLNKLFMHNFKKFRRAEVEFADGLTGIVGGNGAGKSTIVEAIAWSLYGSRASSIKRDFIRNSRAGEGDSVEVKLSLSLGKRELDIYRSMKGKNMSPEAFLFLDGQRIAAGTKEVDQRLEDILKISYQDFMKTFYARQKDLDNLLKEGGMGKREYLLKLLGLEDIKENALEQIKSDRSGLEDQRSRLAGALAEIGEVEARLSEASREISFARKGLEGAERYEAQLLGEKGLRLLELDALNQKMNSHGILAERGSRLKEEARNLEVLIARDEGRLKEIEASKRLLEKIGPSLDRLTGVLARLELLEPKRTLHEEISRKAAVAKSRLEGDRSALEKDENRLEQLEGERARLDELLPQEEEYKEVQVLLARLEELRERHAKISLSQKEDLIRLEGARSNLAKADKYIEDLQRATARYEELLPAVEEAKRLKVEQAQLSVERERQRELDLLINQKKALEDRIDVLQSAAAKIKKDLLGLGDLEGREEQLRQQDRDLDALGSDLNNALADLRGSLKVQEIAFLENERALEKVRSLGSEGLCPTCERPIEGQRDLLLRKYQFALAQAKEEKEKLKGLAGSLTEKIEGVAGSRSRLAGAFEDLNAKRSLRSALQADMRNADLQIREATEEMEGIRAMVGSFGPVSFDAKRLQDVEAALAKLAPMAEECQSLSVRKEELPRRVLEREAMKEEIEVLEERGQHLAEQIRELGYSESQYIEAKRLWERCKSPHEQFITLLERTKEIPALEERIALQKREIEKDAQALEELERSVKDLGFDPEEYSSLLAERKLLAQAEEEANKIKIRLALEPEVKGKLAESQAALEARHLDIARIRAEMESLAYSQKIHELAKLALAEAERNLAASQKDLSDKRIRLGVLEAELERLKEEEKRKKEHQKRLEETSMKLEVVEITRNLVNDFMDQVLIRVKNDIAKAASEILEEVSGKYSLLKIDDDFNIQVEDGGNYYPISRYSGGEIDMIAVSVRVAISEYLMRFGPDGESYSFLILDEVFGSQDIEHREKMIQMLRSLEERFPQIIAISHISDVQGQFDNTLLVVEDELGNSRVEAI